MKLFKNAEQKLLVHKTYLVVSAILVLFGTILGLTASGRFEYLSLRYFTYLSNILVVVGFIILLICYSNQPRLRCYTLISTMLAISVTGIVYNLVLVPLDGNDIFYSSYQNFSNHLLSMILTLLNYFIFEKKGSFTFKHILVGMLFPLLYWLAFASLGGFINFYPYFFMDIAELGIINSLIWLAILLLIFAFLGFWLVVFDRYVGKKQNLLWTIFCRIFQISFKIGSKLLPWREPKLIEGENCLEQLPETILKLNLKSVLIVTDNNLYKLGLTSSLEANLNKIGIAVFYYQETSQNPTIEDVEATVKIYQKNNCEAIIAIGGGSVIDCAKVTGAQIARPKKSVEKMAGLLKIRKKIPPLLVIPTTAGTGSEATLAAVITNSKTHRKFAINDFCLIPKYAFLDPLLTINLPKPLTAATGMDAFTHAIEAFIGRSNTKDTISNATKAFKLISDNLLLAYLDGFNIEARKNMLKASYYAGLSFTKAYVGNVHAAAHPLSGFYGVPHGLANAVLLPEVLDYYGSAAYKKLAKIASIINIGNQEMSNEGKAKAFIKYLRNLNAQMGIPTEFDSIKKEDLNQMIRNALKEANPLYPVPVIFNKQDFENIFNKINSKVMKGEEYEKH